MKQNFFSLLHTGTVKTNIIKLLIFCWFLLRLKLSSRSAPETQNSGSGYEKDFWILADPFYNTGKKLAAQKLQGHPTMFLKYVAHNLLKYWPNVPAYKQLSQIHYRYSNPITVQ
jgi:hypothetical protein